jgi:hypothetical protein
MCYNLLAPKIRKDIKKIYFKKQARAYSGLLDLSIYIIKSPIQLVRQSFNSVRLLYPSKKPGPVRREEKSMKKENHQSLWGGGGKAGAFSSSLVGCVCVYAAFSDLCPPVPTVITGLANFK